jgi:hypothetical protein
MVSERRFVTPPQSRVLALRAVPWEGFTLNTQNALRTVRTLLTGLVVAAAAVTCTTSVSVSGSAAAGHGDESSLVQAKKEWKQSSTPDVVLAKKEYKQLITTTQLGD